MPMTTWTGDELAWVEAADELKLASPEVRSATLTLMLRS
jgi:hypothetical protein